MTDWLHFWFDEQGVYRRATPPNGEAWSDSLAWADVVRVCLEMEDFLGTDSLYILTCGMQLAMPATLPRRVNGTPSVIPVHHPGIRPLPGH